MSAVQTIGIPARAHGVTELLRAAAPRIEAARALTPDVVAALHEARLFRLLLPRSLGGDEAAPAVLAQVTGIIAAADASTAWCLSQGAGCAMAAAYLKPEPARRFFGAPDAVLAWGAGLQGKATAVPGGYRVTGTWTFASGSRHATVLGGHSLVFEADGRPRQRTNAPAGRSAPNNQQDRTLLFRRDQATVHDVWQVMGLKGTGSDTFEVKDLFVPEADTIDREDPSQRSKTSPVYLYSGSLVYASGFAGLMLGIARGAVDDLRALAMTKTARGAGTSLRESPVFQTNLAMLEARLRSLRMYLIGTLEEVHAAVSATRTLSLDQRIAIKLATTYAINQGSEVVTEAYRAAGQTAIFPANPFERRLRDALTATQQTQARTTNFLTAGRHLLGLEPDTWMFL